jgi:hypothetical protein
VLRSGCNQKIGVGRALKIDFLVRVKRGETINLKGTLFDCDHAAVE